MQIFLCLFSHKVNLGFEGVAGFAKAQINSDFPHKMLFCQKGNSNLPCIIEGNL